MCFLFSYPWNYFVLFLCSDSISEDDFDEDILIDLQRIGATEQAQEEQRPTTPPVVAPKKESALRRKPAIRSPSSTSVSGYSSEDEVFIKRDTPSKVRTGHYSLCSMDSSNSASESASSGDVEDIIKVPDTDKDKAATANGVANFPPVPPLPHPRMELTHRTAFDDIRLFLANNRKSDEVFPTPRRTQMRGKSIDQLKEFLDSMT